MIILAALACDEPPIPPSFQELTDASRQAPSPLLLVLVGSTLRLQVVSASRGRLVSEEFQRNIRIPTPPFQDFLSHA